MNTKKKSLIIPVIIVILLVQLACALPFDLGWDSGGSQSDQPMSTVEAPSSAGGEGSNAGSKPPGHGSQEPQAPPASGSPVSGSPAPTSPQGSNPTPQPTPVSQGPNPTPQGSPGGGTNCTNRYTLDGGANVSQGQEFETGESFEVIWPLKNVGTCTWTSDYALKHTNGDSLGAASLVPLNAQAAPGDTIQVSVQMSAPASTGSYLSIWKLVGPQGEAFNQGAPLKVSIQVVQGSSGNNSGISPKPMPVVRTPDLGLFTLVTGDQVTMLDEECYDLTAGEVVSCGNSSASFRYNHNSYYGGILEPKLSLDFSNTMTSKPDKATCQSEAYPHESPVDFTTNPPGIYACFKTQYGGDTVYGWIHPTYFNNTGLTFDFVTYNP